MTGVTSYKIQTTICSSCHSHGLSHLSHVNQLFHQASVQSVAMWSLQSCLCTCSPSMGTVPLVVPRAVCVTAGALPTQMLLAEGLSPWAADRGRWAPAVSMVLHGQGCINWCCLQKRFLCQGTLPWTNTSAISADSTSWRKRNKGRREGNCCFFNLI